MNYRIVELDKALETAYESFIKQFESSLLYHSLSYRNLLVDLLECQAKYYLAVNENNEIVAALPTMEKEGPLGKVLNSLPFYGSNGGLIFSDEDAALLLLQHYQELASAPEVLASTYIENPLQPFTLSFKLKTNETDERIGQLSPLPNGAELKEAVMEALHYKTRNMVRKAMKSDVVVTLDDDAGEFLYQTHKENMEAIGGKAKDRRFFELVPKYFKKGEDYHIYVAHIDGEMVAAMLLFYYNKTVEYFTPVIKAEYRPQQPLSLLIFEAMIQAADKGYKWWNWGGTWNSQEGVYRFKSRWNAEDLPYRYFIYVKNNTIYQQSTEFLLDVYKGFYVLPFSSLASKTSI